MEAENQVSVKSVSIKYGIIQGLVGIILFVILDFTGSTQNFVGMLVSIAAFATIVILAHKEFKDGGDGYMTYGQGLGIGTLVATISSVISAIFTLIYISYINTSYVENIKQQQIVKMEERGMSDAEIEQAMQMAEKFSGPVVTFISTMVIGVLFGFLASLIISAITKKTRPEFG